MAEMSTSTTTRPDIDIRNDILNIVAHYPPLMNDRHHLNVKVRNGVVNLSGHLKSRVSRRYLLEALERVQGIKGVEDERLHDEETIRHEVGQYIPSGVFASIDYGTVILTGRVPAHTSAAEITAGVSQVQGVRRVVTSFHD